MNRTDFQLDKYGLSDDPQFCDWCLGQVVKSLIDAGDDRGIAALMTDCHFSYCQWRGEAHSENVIHRLPVSYDLMRGECVKEIDETGNLKNILAILSGPAQIVDTIKKGYTEVDRKGLPQPLFQLIQNVFDCVLGPKTNIIAWAFRYETLDLPIDWRKEVPDWYANFFENTIRRVTTNQAIFKSIYTCTYAGLRFRSGAEVNIAKALDRHGIMYLPNCQARIGSIDNRVSREPDFLICYNGQWGILEVDGKPFHRHSRLKEDVERDELFRKHGVEIIERYDSSLCNRDPDQVVADFLALLNKNR